MHAFSDDPARKLVLGGVVFDGERGLVGHSDADVVAHAIGLFEPRLTGVTVRAQRDPRDPGLARITVSASEVIGRALRRVNFEIALGDQGGLVTLSP